MKGMSVMGVILMIIGVVLFVFSNSISEKVAEGRGEISSAQSQVDMGNSVMSMHPATKEVGGMFTGSAQNRINAGTEEANYYERMAAWLKIGGVVVFILGVGVLVVGMRKSR